MSRVFVTGGSGLVGTAIQRIVASGDFPYMNENVEWRFLRSIDLDLLNRKAIESYFREWTPTHVIHLAARVGGLFRNQNERTQMIQENLQMNINILEVAHQFKVPVLRAILSTCIFPDKLPSYPIEFKHLHMGPPHSSNEPYAIAKRTMEVQIRAYREQYQYNWQVIVPTNIFGVQDNFDVIDGHVIPVFLHRAWRVKHGLDPAWYIKGTGEPLRQFVTSDEVAKACIWSLTLSEKHPIWLEGFIVTSEQEYSIREIVNMIQSISGLTSHQIQWSYKESENGQLRKPASSEAYEKYKPWKDEMDIMKELTIVYQWILQELASRKLPRGFYHHELNGLNDNVHHE